MEGRVRGSASVRTARRRRAASIWPARSLLVGIALLRAVEAGSAQTAPPTYDELIAKAARQGTLRVIVEVLPDGPAPPTREAIAQAQERVIQELSGTEHRVLRRFATIPFLGLLVSPEALRRLTGSLFVAGIREDIVLRKPL
jgi:hypothetical protein